MTARRRALGAPAGLDTWQTVCADATFSGPDFALFAADASDALAQLPDGSINTCLTSPPYWAVRDYGNHDQIGLEDEVDDYVERLVKVYREVYRVLADDGTAWLNIGDSYFNKTITVGGKPPRHGWKRNKQLSLVPFRVALALQEDGWWLRNITVWQKPNAMPSSVTDRLTNTWEPVFLLAKSERYFFDLDTIRVPHATDDAIERERAESGRAGGKAKGREDLRRWLNSPRHRSTIEGLREIERRPDAPEAVELAAYMRGALEGQKRSIKWVAEQLGEPFERTRHYFRTDEIGSRLPPPATWLRLKELLHLDETYDDAMRVEVGDNVFRNHPRGRNPGDVWSIPVAANRHDHMAVMPRALAERALRATLPPGGSCLDPFMGTGTTGIVARELGGRFVGVDVEASFMAHYLRASGYRER
ncbi:site-specific DNA-methyltransferase [Cellulomonas sp. zg-ZUI222]|uniref:DNA-methyltransferase n=1 Tax=Cellulomonas wangleii TaxID=2816956 RepID=UPI001A94A81A|nr:site-specific DNA-methyltransferase [Cellulomonas wangleii]MBO0920366.1 site-specific DNA-methyltransferase [Cellulomonas wangleii]